MSVSHGPGRLTRFTPMSLLERGSVLIEGNAEWSTSLLQIPAPRGLMTGEFKALCQTLTAAQTRGR